MVAARSIEEARSESRKALDLDRYSGLKQAGRVPDELFELEHLESLRLGGLTGGTALEDCLAYKTETP